MTYFQREIITALQRWGAGNKSFTDEEDQRVVMALAEVVRVLHSAPSGNNPVATGVWFNHERAPALARLSDALHPHRQGAALADHTERMQTDHEVVVALQRALARGR